MNPVLDLRSSPIPLEREYEAWLVRALEDYFESVGAYYFIRAVSPISEEKSWPGDQLVFMSGKVFGLQVKRPNLQSTELLRTKAGEPRSRRECLHFTLEREQKARVVKIGEIYYALPTFLSRDYRRSCLHHFEFWRPRKSHSGDISICHPRGRATAAGVRWGTLIERVLECNVGRRVDSVRALEAWFSEIREASPTADLPGAPRGKEVGDELLIIYVGFP